MVSFIGLRGGDQRRDLRQSQKYNEGSGKGRDADPLIQANRKPTLRCPGEPGCQQMARTTTNKQRSQCWHNPMNAADAAEFNNKVAKTEKDNTPREADQCSKEQRYG